MKFKLALSTATALGLLMGGAMADGNESQLLQSGAGNTANFNQSTATESNIGRPGVYHSSHNYGNIVQSGAENRLSITQEGRRHDISRWAGASDTNLRQNGDRNEIQILQQNISGTASTVTGSSIHGITQTGTGSVAPNTLNVVQTNNGVATTATHGIRNIQQTNTVTAATAADTNTIDILQSGTGYQRGNVVRNTSQNGSGNAQDIDQIGQRNHINSVSQTGAGNSLDADLIGNYNAIVSVTQTNAGGTRNSATVKLSGDNNGQAALGNWAPWSIPNVALATAFSVGSYASGIAGVTQAVIYQNGTGNILGYEAVGNENRYGFNQDGNGNLIDADVTGNSNQLAIYQYRDGNDALIDQHSSNNDAGIRQNGDNNYVNAKQTGTGDHSLNVSVDGNDNGRGAFGALINAFAATKGLSNGDVFQEGFNNSASLTIANSNNNKFAFLQNGSDNRIAASITGNTVTGSNQILGVQDGSNNAAQIGQTGSNNVTVFQQVGSGNTATFLQGAGATLPPL